MGKGLCKNGDLTLCNFAEEKFDIKIPLAIFVNLCYTYKNFIKEVFW